MTPEAATPTVVVVDDDPAFCRSIRWLIEADGLDVETYDSAQAFLNAFERDTPGCLLLDMRMPGMSGLELQKALEERGIAIPVIVVTAHGDVPTAVRAMKAGAVDFIQKPFNDQELLDRVHECIARDAENRRDAATQLNLEVRLSKLSAREREVMDLVIAGRSNKAIAQALGISIKTVEFHRAHIMEKMQAGSVQELVHLADISITAD